MTNNAEYQSLMQLLPFYVNGTLGATDCARIDTVLATSSELRAELELQHQIARKTIEEGRVMTANSANPTQALKSIMPRLKASAISVKMDGSSSATSPSFSALLSFLHPRHWHPAISLSLAVAVAGLGGIITAQNANQQKSTVKIANLETRIKEAEFQLASGPSAETLRGNILIQLQDNATWAQVEALLLSEDLTIVNGPSDGALSLSTNAKGAALNTSLSRLKSSTIIATADKIS